MQVTQINKIDKNQENFLRENNIFECPHCHKTSDLKKTILLNAKKEWENEEKPKLEKKYKVNHDEELQKLQENYNQSQNNKVEQQIKEKTKHKFEEKDSRIKNLEASLKEYSSDRKKLNELKLINDKLQMSKDEDESRIKLEEHERSKEEKDKLAEEFNIERKQYKLKIEQIEKKAKDIEKSANQGPIQEQGEGMELTLEEWLKKTFPEDQISEVKKFANGADIIQRVKNGLGTICIESKNTKEFNKKWIKKIKKDMQEVSANKGIIVTKTLPSDLPQGGYRDRIWIYDIRGFKKIIYPLRQAILEESKLIQSNSNSKEKSVLAYRYILSDDYNNEIATQIENWMDESTDLDKEIVSTQARWAKRRARYDAIKKSMSNIYGNFKHIMGTSIPDVKMFELPKKEIITKKKKGSK